MLFLSLHCRLKVFHRFGVEDARQNVVALLDSTGAVVVKYRYDACGSCQTTVLHAGANAIAELNPFRYRSYYFDTETGLFLVSSRYYDPETGRFISPDEISYLDSETIGGLNLYAYCLNNPVNYYDPEGVIKIAGAPGGIFNTNGLIRSFWYVLL